MTTDVMVNSPNPALYEAPEAFDGVGVRVAHNIDFLTVLDAPMPVAVDVVSKIVIDRVVVSKDHRVGQDVFFDNAHNGVLLNVLRGVGPDAALPLDNADYGSLFPVAASGATAIPAPASADISFVNLNSGAALAAQRSVAVSTQHRPNLLEHPPRRLVGHSRFPFNLLCRDAAASLRHEEDSVEPRCQRSAGLVKDRASRRMNVITAMVARIGRAASQAVMFRNLFTVLAVDAAGVQVCA